jgi:Xaa-Pro aminopeptidase
MNLKSNHDFGERRNRLRKTVGQGWLLLYKGAEHFNENLYYLTGLDAFHTFALISLETDQEYVATNLIEYPNVKVSCDIQNIQSCSSNELISHLVGLLSEHKVSILYCDYAINSRTSLPAELIDRLRIAFPQMSIEPLPSQLLCMRMIKDSVEIAIIKEGIKIIGVLFAGLPEIIRPGILERELASEIYKTLVKNGFNKFYDILVASGPNSAIPLYRDKKSRLPDQGVVLIDICAAFEYYVCDLCRTFPVQGILISEQHQLYSIIMEVQKKAISCVRPGMSLARLSDMAKETFARHGLDKYYLNKIGHFVGLAPDDPGDQEAKFEQRMVLTIEPGLYIPDERLGLRIEDTVIVE